MYPFDQLSFQGAISAVLCDLANDGKNGLYSDVLKSVPSPVKATFGALQLKGIPDDLAPGMLLDELKSAFRDQYETGQLTEYVACMKKGGAGRSAVFSLPFPSCASNIFTRLLEWQCGVCRQHQHHRHHHRHHCSHYHLTTTSTATTTTLLHRQH